MSSKNQAIPENFSSEKEYIQHLENRLAEAQGTIQQLIDSRAKEMPESDNGHPGQALENEPGKDQSAQELERIVAERTQELKLAYQKLNESNQRLSEAYRDLEYELAERERAEGESDRLLTMLATERRKAQNLAAENEQNAAQLEAVFNAITDAVVVVDGEGHVVRYNPAASRIFGFDPSKTREKEITQAISVRSPNGKALKDDELPYRRVLKGQPVMGERYIFRYPSGMEKIVEVSARLLRNEDGSTTGAVAVFHDITEIEQIARLQSRLLVENRQQKDLLQAIFNSDPSAIAILSGPDYVFQMVNPAYRAITPDPELDPVGRKYDEVWAPVSGFQMAGLLQHVIETGEVVHSDRHRRHYLDKPDRYFSLNVSRFKWQNEPAALIVMWETTRLEKAQQAVESAVEEARRELALRQVAEKRLLEHAKELEQKNSELQDFAFIASHDLQEPLRKVQAFGDRLKLGYEDQLDEAGRDFIDRMRAASIRMQEMLDDLLLYSRVSTRGQPVAQVDLTDVVNQAVSDLEFRMREAGGTVEVTDLPQIEADPSQMRQLFVNMIGNALKFHKPDTPPQVHITGRIVPDDAIPGNQAAEITIEDNGIGFEEKYLDRIFQPFQRLHGRNSSYRGNGMGLAICRKIIERHGGRITATSIINEGSTFTIHLPLKQKSDA